MDGTTITFRNLEPLTVSARETFTLITPNAADVLVVDSLALGRNRVSGTSGGTLGSIDFSHPVFEQKRI